MEVTAEPVDLLGPAGQGLVSPAVRDRAQQGDQRGRRGQHDVLGRGVVEQVAVGRQRGGEERLGRHEQHHELRRPFQRAPVALGGQLVDVLAQLAGVAGQVGLALVVVIGARGVEERVERHLRVDHHPTPADQLDDEVGALDAVVASDRVGLLGEVAPVDQPGQLDGAAQVHLAPAAADLRLAQRRRQRLGLAPQRVGGRPHVEDLLAELPLPGGALVVEVAHLVAEPVESLDQLGPVDARLDRRGDVRRPRAHPEHAQGRTQREPQQQHQHHRDHHAHECDGSHRQWWRPPRAGWVNGE